MFVFFSSDLRPQPHILWQPRGWVCPTYPASAPSTTTWSILIISNKDCQRTSSIQEEFTKPCLNMICQVSVWILTLQYSSSTDMGQEVFHSIFTEEIQGSITKYLISFFDKYFVPGEIIWWVKLWTRTDHGVLETSTERTVSPCWVRGSTPAEWITTLRVLTDEDLVTNTSVMSTWVILVMVWATSVMGELSTVLVDLWAVSNHWDRSVVSVIILRNTGTSPSSGNTIADLCL